MKKQQESSTKKEILIQILPLLRDIIAIFLERLAELQGKPTLKRLQQENEELRKEIQQLEKKFQWIFFFIIVQTFFIVIIFIYIIIKF
ncbi:MAG: hypothetical protein N2247_11775 [Leptospiraceae bacterium]|jgi:hypothetical protein|nr:hypothetical protein [Leptospiraceae bacterium]